MKNPDVRYTRFGTYQVQITDYGKPLLGGHYPTLKEAASKARLVRALIEKADEDEGIPASLKRLIHDWNRLDQELETLWRDNDKPRGKAWEKLAAPLWDEQTKVQEELAPLLVDWASKEGLGYYGHTVFGVDGWARTAKDCYRKIKERTGINESSFHIGQLLKLGGRIRSAEENKKGILAMSDEEFERDFCTRTDEGKRLKEVFLKLRAAQNKRKTEKGTST